MRFHWLTASGPLVIIKTSSHLFPQLVRLFIGSSVSKLIIKYIRVSAFARENRCGKNKNKKMIINIINITVAKKGEREREDFNPFKTRRRLNFNLTWF